MRVADGKDCTDDDDEYDRYLAAYIMGRLSDSSVGPTMEELVKWMGEFRETLL